MSEDMQAAGQKAVDDAQVDLTPDVQKDDGSTEAPDAQAGSDTAPEGQADETGEHGAEGEFPKKAVNAIHRRNKQINKLRAQMRELEAKLNEAGQEPKSKEINPDDFENYGDYINAQVEALVSQKTQQSQSDLQKQMLTQQQEALKAQRDQHIIEQAREVSQVLPDLPEVWQQNAQLLDALPEQVSDIFYSIENAPAAIYTLAKEGKLESLLYANPAVAAYEIVNAQNKGLEMISSPKNRTSQAPAPISKARGSGTVKKQLSPSDDVLKSLGLKR